LITGKTRIPRKLEPLIHSKTPKYSNEDEEIEKIKKETKTSSRFEGLMENMSEIYMNKDQQPEAVKEKSIGKNLEIEKQDGFKVENQKNLEKEEKLENNQEIKENNQEVVEKSEKDEKNQENQNLQISEIPKEGIEAHEIKIKPEKKILENGSGVIQWETSQTRLTLESMKISVEGFEGFVYIPISQLKYIIFNTRSKIQVLIQKFLRVDSSVKWFFYKKKSRKSLKKQDASSEFPFIIEETPPNPFPESFEFEANINRGPYSYSSGVARKVSVLLPVLLFNTEKIQKKSLVSLNNLKGLLKKSSSFPQKVTDESFKS
jgi:hypothetical protein